MRFRHRKKIRKKRLQTRQDRIMTLANFISISRIFLAMPLVIYLQEMAGGDRGKMVWAFGIILLIVLTDLLDGYVARKADEITNFGKLIDPVADKVCLMVVMIYLIFTYKLPFLLFFLLLSVRDIFLIIIGVYLIFAHKEIFQSNWSGKWFLGITTLMMALFLFQEPLSIPAIALWTSFLTAIILFTVSTAEYIKRYLSFFKGLEQE